MAGFIRLSIVAMVVVACAAGPYVSSPGGTASPESSPEASSAATTDAGRIAAGGLLPRRSLPGVL